jgi:L-lactate utilization protein LutB
MDKLYGRSFMDFIKEAYKVKAATVIKNLEKRQMEGYYCETAEEAVNKVMSMIKQDDTVGWGGSTTIDQMGIKKLLEERKIAVYDRDKETDPKERVKMMKKALTADVFLTSTNAITMEGELLNIDGNGNRVAAMVSNLLVVLCGNRDAQPIVNSGSLY